MSLQFWACQSSISAWHSPSLLIPSMPVSFTCPSCMLWLYLQLNALLIMTQSDLILEIVDPCTSYLSNISIAILTKVSPLPSFCYISCPITSWAPSCPNFRPQTLNPIKACLVKKSTRKAFTTSVRFNLSKVKVDIVIMDLDYWIEFLGINGGMWNQGW